MPGSSAYVRRFEVLSAEDVPQVGGTNASLGEMIAALKDKGIEVPHGFATTARVYHRYLDANEIEHEIRATLDAFHATQKPLEEAGATIRKLIEEGEIPEDIRGAISEAYHDEGLHRRTALY